MLRAAMRLPCRATAVLATRVSTCSTIGLHGVAMHVPTVPPSTVTTRMLSRNRSTTAPIATTTNSIAMKQQRAMSSSQQEEHRQHRVLILGGYGTFGSMITTRLASYGDGGSDINGNDDNSSQPLDIIIGGRSLSSAARLVDQLRAIALPGTQLHPMAIDINEPIASLQQRFKDAKIDTVVHTCGPFMGQVRSPLLCLHALFLTNINCCF
jgi:hypothetical protein